MGDWIDSYKGEKAAAITAAEGVALEQRRAVERIGELHKQILSYLHGLSTRLSVGYVTGEELSTNHYVFFPTTVINLQTGQKQKSGPAEWEFDLLYRPEVEIREEHRALEALLSASKSATTPFDITEVRLRLMSPHTKGPNDYEIAICSRAERARSLRRAGFFGGSTVRSDGYFFLGSHTIDDRLVPAWLRKQHGRYGSYEWAFPSIPDSALDEIVRCVITRQRYVPKEGTYGFFCRNTE